MRRSKLETRKLAVGGERATAACFLYSSLGYELNRYRTHSWFSILKSWLSFASLLPNISHLRFYPVTCCWPPFSHSRAGVKKQLPWGAIFSSKGRHSALASAHVDASRHSVI
ncbi:hypothetical protein VTK56DRAFT_9546 [Thermocarpiscus australiensis]